MLPFLEDLCSEVTENTNQPKASLTMKRSLRAARRSSTLKLRLPVIILFGGRQTLGCAFHFFPVKSLIMQNGTSQKLIAVVDKLAWNNDSTISNSSRRPMMILSRACTLRKSKSKKTSSELRFEESWSMLVPFDRRELQWHELNNKQRFLEKDGLRDVLQ